MSKDCVFKVEYKGELYRVVKHHYDNKGRMFVFRVEHKRRVLGKFKSISDQGAIEFALKCAFGDGSWIEGGLML